MLEVGKNYVCTTTKLKGFTYRNHYLAVSDDQLMDNYGAQVYFSDITGLFEKEIEKQDTKEKVNHPSHYNKGGIEVLDIIKAFYGEDSYENFCVGNVVKYILRYRHKDNATEDLQKAKFYLEEILKLHNPNN